MVLYESASHPPFSRGAQKYELILGLKPDLSADKQKKILEKVKKLIADAGGKVEEVKSRGLTKLAYPITGFAEASFTTIFLAVPGEKIKSLQKEVKQIKEILRMMFVREEVKR